MSGVSFQDVVKRYGEVEAVRRLNLEIEEGEFLTLLGPSGCGKTTTLRLIAGFILPTSGVIRLGEEDVTNLPPQRRNIGMVFQNYALFPHLTIAENIGFGLVERRVPKASIKKRVDELLELVKLPGTAGRYPAELSGGQQQRVAVARAVAFPPRVLLMDEPLGALDLKLREVMQVELRRIQQELGITTVYVTHDQYEAMNMSDRVAVMNEGVLEQLDTPEELYRQPRTRFVANFIGQMNCIEGRTESGSGDLLTVVGPRESKIKVRKADRELNGDLAVVGIRPEAIRIAGDTESSDGYECLTGMVTGSRFNGNLVSIFVDIGDGCSFTIEDRPNNYRFSDGQSVKLLWKTEDAVLLVD